MHYTSHYDTVSGAISKLRSQGFILDFNLEENCIICETKKFNAEDMEIVQIYRYEGNSDPSDEAMVYALESKSGLKGILVDGYGISSNPKTAQILRSIPVRT